MNRVLLLLFMIGSAFANNIVLNSLTNETYNLDFSACINITIDDSYVIACAPSHPKVNQVINLGYGQNYTNTTLNVTIIAPDLPKANQEINLSYGQNYTNTSLNLTVYAPIFPQVNLNKILAYNETYQNTSLNLTLIAPGYPTINQNITLDYNGKYENSTLNLTVNSKPFPTIKTNLSEGQKYTNSTIEIWCNSILKNQVINLDFDQKYTDQEHNITYVAPQFPSINKNILLKYGENVLAYGIEPRYNLSVQCTAESAPQISDCQTKISKIEQEKTEAEMRLLEASTSYKICNATLSVLQNKTSIPCNSSVITFCADGVASMCTAEEKVLGDVGIMQCINRINQEANKTKTDYITETTKLSTELAQCRSGENIQRELQENMLLIIAGIAGIFSAAFIVANFLKTKQLQNE